MRPLCIVVALTVVTAAHAEKPNLRLPAPSTVPTAGANLRRGRATPTPSRLPGYFEEHSARVSHDMLFFQHGYTLDQMRERDELMLYGPTPGGERASLDGAALLAGTIVLTAHAPRAVRRIFDGRWHVGPAILYGGGMGAGVGGHF